VRIYGGADPFFIVADRGMNESGKSLDTVQKLVKGFLIIIKNGLTEVFLE
jgi:hypothetical protein